jgi:glyceraldehyde-3-phosphate dehydrogenase/erythrose-4-phosphate dehydrogenase
MRRKIAIFILFVLLGFPCFSQQKDSLSSAKQKESNIVAADSARIALDIIVDSTGKLISATYAAESSTTNNEKMIAIAKRRANQIKYPVMKQQYRQRLLFIFRIAQ